jgi:hypothetical protein
MKKSTYILIILLFLIITKDMKAQVGIGTATPNASSMLDITSTNSGLLIPRVALISTSDVATIASPVTSLLVYNSGFLPNGYYYWNGTLWVLLATGNNTGWSLTGNSGTNPANNFIGTTDAQDLRFRRANQWAGTIASSVTSFGAQAGRTNTSTNNVFFGSNAGELSSNAASSNMVAIGHQAMGAAGAQNVSQSVAIGSFAMQSPTATATSNVVIGHQAGPTLSTSNNVIIGQGASSGFASCIVIGQGAASTANNHIRIGNSQTLATTPASWTVISDRRAKSDIKNSALGLDFIKTLRPVSYFKKNDENKKTEYGFIAQEVEATLKKAGDSNNGVIYVDPDGNYGMRYNDIIPITVKAVQDQQLLIEQLLKTNEKLLKDNQEILKRLEALEKK